MLPHNMIERSNLDGSNRMAILYSSGVIVDIVVDTTSNQLYWIRMDTHAMHVSDLDGSNERFFIPGPSASTQNYILEPRGMAKVDNQFFWTERQSTWQALQTGPKNFLVRKVSAFETNPNRIVVVNPLRPGGKE